MSTNSDEFRFTDQQWRAYQNMPEQGYSHRGHLEWVFNTWLAEHDRSVSASAWDECLSAIDANELNTEQARDGNPYANALILGIAVPTDER